eukprot:TRINITY_DN5395_c0_g1_i1.p2 TRINITY_DN5395_c0_g1~~TRINITY_DN5395_c0_g1_i1.p2  ORF type:complete len:128 (-),score=51.00 TRINITY_DN5395_c0_g1_i1:169-552(-)
MCIRDRYMGEDIINMFEQFFDEYTKTKAHLERENENTKKNMKNLVEPVTKEMFHNLNDRVLILHNNQIIIERETKELKNECVKFYKEANQWMDLYNQLNEALKEVGDVVNWANVIQEDLKEVVEKMN